MRIPGGLLFLLFVPGTALAQTSEEAAVRTLWLRFEHAFNAGDAVTIGTLFTESADRINGSSTAVRGRSAIQSGYAAMLARRARDASAQPFRPRITVRLVSPDVALLDGEWKGARAGREIGGRFVMVAVKRNGMWLFDAGRAWEFESR